LHLTIDDPTSGGQLKSTPQVTSDDVPVTTRPVAGNGHSALSQPGSGVTDEDGFYEGAEGVPARSPAFADPRVRAFEAMDLPEIAERAGLSRIDVVAWRDFDDPEAGGSELHAHRVVSAWAAAGLDITMVTSSVPDARRVIRRDGYRVVRRSGRYSVFPRTMLSGLTGTIGGGDGLVEIWNGMPFLSPVWARSPRVVFLHHVHAEMWKMVLPNGLAQLGHAIEHRMAPPIYRRSQIVTLSTSSKNEIVERLHIPADQVTVSPPGVEPAFSPGGERSEVPLVVAVGRLVPVKRFELLIDALVRLKARHPELRAVIVGEGYERAKLEALVAGHGAGEWISLPGYVSADELIGLYRQAWVVASTSLREGWGMTVTEAGACATPSVVSRISGHQDAVVHGRSGLLVDNQDEMVGALDATLADEIARKRMGIGAQEHAEQFTWSATARVTLAVLAAESMARRERGSRR
jgi:glycosyltransferase involved in cell wall biosynthesis